MPRKSAFFAEVPLVWNRKKANEDIRRAILSELLDVHYFFTSRLTTLAVKVAASCTPSTVTP